MPFRCIHLQEARNHYIKKMSIFALNDRQAPSRIEMRSKHALYKFEALDILRKSGSSTGLWQPLRLECDLDAALQDFEKIVKDRREEVLHRHSNIRNTFCNRLMLFCFVINEVQLIAILLILLL